MELRFDVSLVLVFDEAESLIQRRERLVKDALRG